MNTAIGRDGGIRNAGGKYMSERETKRPVGSHERQKLKVDAEVPVNLERVLLEAAQDEVFCNTLITDGARALAEKGFSLRTSEQAMLSTMSSDALEKMVERLRPDKLKRSTFAKYVVTALAGSMIVTASSACGGEESDWPEYGGGNEAFDASTETGGSAQGGKGGRAGNTTAGKGGASGSAGNKGEDSGT